MPSFVESCYCRGIQPAGIVSKRRISRPECVGLLLQDRNVSRFLVAPDGYGKTHVAFEYASIMFAFEHVFWIRGTSPCFVRDLDAGTLVEEIMRVDNQAKLVIFDALPHLDATRSQAFSSLLDTLLLAHCEVLVTCTPSSDMFESLQKDRSLITSKDLLLADEEVAVLETSDELHANIACIAWSSKGHEQLLEGCAKEKFPSDVKSVLFLAMTLGRGELRALSELYDTARAQEIISYLSRYYTFLGIKVDSSSFYSCRFSLATLKRYFADIDDIYQTTPLSSAEELCTHITERLLNMHETERAFQMAVQYLSHAQAEVWLEHHGWKLIQQSYPLGALRLIDYAFQSRAMPPSVLLMKAWSLICLGETKKSNRFATRVMRSAHSSSSQKCSAIIARMWELPLDGSAELSLQLTDALAALDPEQNPVQEGCLSDLPGCTELNWYRVGTFLFSFLTEHAFSLEVSKQTLQRCVESDFAQNLVCAVTSDIFACLWALSSPDAAEIFDENNPALPDELGMFECICQYVCEVCNFASSYELLKTSLAWLLSQFVASETIPPLFRVRIQEACSQALLLHLGAIGSDLFEQNKQRIRQEEDKAQKRARFEATHPDIYRKRSKEKPLLFSNTTPQLEICMFGGLQVRIDGELVDPRKFSRRRARTMMTALALNKGKELPRSRVSEIVWPNMRPEESRNSFYSVWGELKKALTIGGECPYLVRSQMGCSFDARFLSTDMEEFESTCSALVFGGNPIDSWENLYTRITTSFTEPLLPSETESSYINDIRMRCINRIVDGMIAASSRLQKMGEYTGALWFSREALMRDDKREDVYISLMEAQLSAGQRGPALETYFKCRDFLAEDLGIDPSARLVDLYRSIIEYEEQI